MSKILTATELSAIRARCEAATPGPWEEGGDDKFHVFALGTEEKIATMRVRLDSEQNCCNAIFISEARTDVPALLAHIEEQRATLAKAEADKAALGEALEWLMKAYEMILPGVAKISIPDYALMNDAPCQASAILASVKAQP